MNGYLKPDRHLPVIFFYIHVTRLRLKTDSLAYALCGAAAVVSLVQSGTALPPALLRVAARADMPQQARGAVQDIAYRSMRMWGRANALVKLLVAKPPFGARSKLARQRIGALV